MKIQAPLNTKLYDILLCSIECYDKNNTIVAEIKERVLYCRLRGLYSETNYTKHVNRDALKKTKSIKLVAVKIIGTANDK